MSDSEWSEYGSMNMLRRQRRTFVARFVARVVSVLMPVALLLTTSHVSAAELEDATKALRAGDYATCIKITDKAVQARLFGEEYYLLKAEAELATGESRRRWTRW